MQRLALVLLLTAMSLAFAAPAQACNRSQCKYDLFCYRCESLMLLIVECWLPECWYCDHFNCSMTGEEGEVAGLLPDGMEAACSDEASPEEPTVEVLQIDWVASRT